MNKNFSKIIYVFMSTLLLIGQLVFPVNLFAETIDPKAVGDDPGVIIKATNPIGSNGDVEMRVTLFGSAGHLKENGTVEVKIPKSIVASPDQLSSLLVYESPFYLASTPAYTDDGQGNYVLQVQYDASKIDQTKAFNQTFTVKFRSSYFTDHSKVPETVSFTTNLQQNGQTISTDTVSSETRPTVLGQPSFLKYSDLPYEITGNNTKNYLLDTTEKTKNNIFILMVNYNRQSYDDVTITDELPKDTVLYDSYPILTGITSGDSTPVQHINIYKADQFNENGTPKHFTYVTSQMVDRISTTDTSLSVHLGKVTPDDAYVITYGLNVTPGITPQDFGTRYNNARMTSGNIVKESNVPVILKKLENDASVLEKSVDKTQLATNSASLEYRLKTESNKGKIPAGTVITDPLPEHTTFEKMTVENKELFSDPYYDSATNRVTFVIQKDINEGEFGELAFSVRYDNPQAKVGEVISNKASFNPSGTLIYSTAATTVIAGSASLVKTDRDTGEVLPGAVFKVIDANGQTIAENLTTNEQGIVQTGVLSHGSYSFVETQAPQGYELDATPIPFTVTENQTEPVKISAVNKAMTGSVTLTKLDKETQTALAGAVFELQTEDGQVIKSNIETDTSGKLTIADLKAGKYQLVETQAPTGYQLDPTPVSFEIKKGETTPVQVQKENTLIKGGVILTKEDSEDGRVLPGAVFELQDEKGNTLQKGLTTNESGRLEINDLVPGKYQLVETEAPTGYEIDATPIVFTVEKGKKDPVQLTKKNKAIPGSVLLTKVDSKNGKALAGAIFALQDQTGKVLQENLVTDNFGRLAVANLQAGKYQLVETQAPKGYKLDATPITFEITKDMSHKNVEVSKKNAPKEKNVRLEKRDRQTKQLLAGAEFELRNASGEVLKSGLVTDKNGVLLLEGLEQGSYQLVETKAPEGYTLDSTPVVFTLNDETMTINVTKYNSKEIKDTPVNPTDKKDTPTTGPKSPGTKKQSTQKASVNGNHTYFPKTGEERNKWLPLTGGIVVISILGWIILNQKRKKSPNKSFDD